MIHNEASHRRKYLVEKETASVHRDKEGRLNSEVQPRRGLKSALETARVVFARVYRLHPSAHNFAPIERQRERKRGAKGLVAQQRDEQRWTKIARLSACVRLYASG